MYERHEIASTNSTWSWNICPWSLLMIALTVYEEDQFDSINTNTFCMPIKLSYLNQSASTLSRRKTKITGTIPKSYKPTSPWELPVPSERNMYREIVELCKHALHVRATFLEKCPLKKSVVDKNINLNAMSLRNYSKLCARHFVLSKLSLRNHRDIASQPLISTG